MKRILFLILVVSQVALFGQTGIYQLPNPGFENWGTDQGGNNGSTGPIPVGFNSYHSGYCTSGMLGTCQGVATRCGQSTTDIRPGSSGTSSLRLFSSSVIGVRANGNVTTGRIYMGSISASNVNNYNYTDYTFNAPQHYQEFSGTPDSMRFWVKYLPGRNGATNTTDKGRIRVYIHGTGECRDAPVFPSGKVETDYYYGKAVKEFYKENGGWYCYTEPFVYDGSNTQKNANNNYYMLVSMTTNSTPGGGANNADQVWFDDIEFIYNPQYLIDLKIADVTPSNFHKDTLTYNHYLCPGEALPIVSYTPSSRADVDVEQADIYNPFASITVKHEGNPNVVRTYTVNFIYRNPIAIPTTQNVLLCGAGQADLSATVGANGTICRWYSDTMNAPIATGASYPLGQCTKDTVLFVSSYNATTGCESYKIPVSVKINTIPGIPTVTNDTICGVGTVNLFATVGTAGTVCRWYASDTSTNFLAENNSFSFTANKDTSLWVSSYNANTECESDKVQVKAVVNPVPAIPSITNDTLCGAGIANLSAQVGINGNTCRWYASNVSTTLLFEGNNYQTTVNNTTSFWVSSYNTATKCESDRVEIKAVVHSIPQILVVNNDTLCGIGTANLSAQAGANEVVRWYTNNISETVLAQTNSLNFSADKDTTFWISSYNPITKCESNRVEIKAIVYSIPAIPIAINDTLCGEGTANLSAQTGINETLRWYASDVSTTVLAQTNSMTFFTDEDTSLWVSSYNPVTKCESGKIEVKAVVNPVPQQPVVYNDSICGSGSHTLNVQFPQTGMEYIWFTSNDTPLDTTNSYTQIFTEPTLLKVASYNPQTGCQSESINVTLKVNPQPEIPFLETTYCVEDILTLIPTIGESGTTINWYNDISDGSPFRTGNTHILSNLTPPQSFVYYLTSANITTKCESERTAFEVQIHPIYDTVLKPVVGCNSYLWNDSLYRESGIQSKTFESIHGCDSVVSISITILNSVTTTLNDTTCEGDNYQRYGFDFIAKTSAAYSDTLIAENGCDSIVVLNLKVYPSYHPDTIRAGICGSGTYNFFGKILTQGGIYDTVFTTVHGCDSLVVLDLEYSNAFVENIHKTICFGETYSFKGENLEDAGIYRDTLAASNGCDSIVVLHLNIRNEILPSQFFIDTCLSYTWSDSTFTESTIYTKTLLTANGCDSIVTMNLIINNPPQITHIYDTACISYTWNETTYNISGEYNQTLLAKNGCDSVVTLHLMVNNPPEIIHVYDTACVSFSWNGTIYDASGEYNKILIASNGCDSITTLHLVINNPTIYDTAHTVCDSYQWKGNIYTESEILYDTIFGRASNGCDSIIRFELTVNKSAIKEMSHVACESFTWNDSLYTESAILYDTIFGGAVSGCDSITIMDLTINPIIIVTLNQTACGSFLWNGTVYTQSEILYDTLFGGAVSGCDSITIMDLIINPIATDSITEVACGSFLWNGTSYTQSGIYTDTVFNGAVNGCDSISYLKLTINELAIHDIYYQECNSYTWKGNTYYSSGNYSDTIIGGAVNGCDSITILHLTIKEPVTYEFDHFECGSYDWKGTIYMQSQIINDTLFGEASNGCDSITILNLTINNPVTYETYDTACMSYEWKGNFYTESIILNDTLIAENGCDSIIIINLTVNYPTDTITIYDAVCQGYTYTENGFDLPVQTITGEYERMIDCDTVLVLHLTVNRNYSREITYTACDSYTWNDSIYYESGNYIQTFTTIHGCDSIVTLKLTINSSSDSVYITDGICQGEVYSENGFNLPAQETAGTFEYTINPKNSSGCDSIIHLTLTVYPAGKFNIQDTVKVGETYNKHGFDITPEVSGIYRDTLYLKSSYDCDSTIILLLIAQKGTNINENDNIEQKVHLFPNPAQHQVTISASISMKQIEIYDIDGKLLDIVHSKDSMEIVYDINRYSTGLYFVKIQTANGILTKKLIIQ